MSVKKNEGAERRCKLKTVSEAKLLDFYNTRDTIRIVGSKEDWSSDNKISESYSPSMQKVLQLAEIVGPTVAAQDISIAHRLPIGNQSKKRRIIVKFSRLISKIKMLQKKKHHGTLQGLKHIENFDDLTLPRLPFFN